MKSQKLVKLFITLFIAFVLTGCTDNSSSPSLSKSGDPAVRKDKPIVTLKYYTIGTPDADLAKVNTALNALLEKKINIHVEYNKINWGDYGRSLSNIINSGTDFDIAFAAGADQGDYAGNARNGVWLALDPYLNTIGKDMYHIINPLFWEGVKINNKIFGVPTNKEIAVPEWWIFKKDFVNRYNIDISKYKTLESLDPIFQKIHQSNPEYTIMELDTNSHNFFALESYEYIINRSVPLMVKSTDKDLKIVNIYETELAKQILGTLRKYYKAGYINEDAAVKANSALSKDEKVFWRECGAGPNQTTSWSKDTGYEVIAQQVSPSIITTESARGGIMVISERTRHPEACIRFLNCLNTDPEVRNLVNFGIEGLHYELTSEGQVSVKNNSGYVGVQYTQGNWFILKTLKGDPTNKWEIYKKFNSTAIKSEALDFTPDLSAPSVVEQLNAVSRVTDKYYPGLMTGTIDPQVGLPLYLKELKSAGIDELKNTLQKQINEWKAHH